MYRPTMVARPSHKSDSSRRERQPIGDGGSTPLSIEKADLNGQRRVKALTADMRAQLDKEYDSMSQMEWIQAMRFLESLGYETRFAPGARSKGASRVRG